ncbi:MAG: hypothetical protein II383_06440 [Bacteroidales bacterium]|nr:hypothetical protein [Bacteroidales bacterium]
MPTRRHQKGQIGAYHSWREEADPLFPPFPPFPPFPDEQIVGPNALQDPMYAIVEKEYIYAGPFRLVQEMFPASITLESVATVGGRIVKNGNNLQPRYFITDHLGSTRVVLDNFGSVLERYDYYPYGEIVPVSVASSGNTDYLYTGKESQNALFGINWYDSGARFQTTDGIFTGIDPLAEKYYHISPYAYCAGNPVNLVDPQGDSTTVYLARNAVAGAGHIAVAVSYSDHPQSDEQYLWSRNGERNERGKTLFGRTVGGIDDEGTAITSDVQEFLNTNTKRWGAVLYRRYCNSNNARPKEENCRINEPVFKKGL